MARQEIAGERQGILTIQEIAGERQGILTIQEIAGERQGYFDDTGDIPGRDEKA